MACTSLFTPLAPRASFIHLVFVMLCLLFLFFPFSSPAEVPNSKRPDFPFRAGTQCINYTLFVVCICIPV